MKNFGIALVFSALIMLIASCAPVQTTQERTQEDIDNDPSLHGEEAAISEPDESMDGKWVMYNGYNDYLVTPKAEGKYPAVVMIHEWWGLNQNIKNMAHDLAEEGYVVLAVDLYGGKVAEVPDDARTYASEVRENPEAAIEHMKAAVSYLNSREDVIQNDIASMGWCFGGGMSLQLSFNENLSATVIYYGNLVTDPEQLDAINWPVLGVFGEEDTGIPVSSVNEFDAALDELGVENEIYIYEGVGHAFANPSNAGHDAEKTKDAWEKTVEFLNKNLKA